MKINSKKLLVSIVSIMILSTNVVFADSLPQFNVAVVDTEASSNNWAFVHDVKAGNSTSNAMAVSNIQPDYDMSFEFKYSTYYYAENPDFSLLPLEWVTIDGEPLTNAPMVLNAPTKSVWFVEKYILESGETRQFNFTIDVPADAEPGAYRALFNTLNLNHWPKGQPEEPPPPGKNFFAQELTLLITVLPPDPEPEADLVVSGLQMTGTPTNPVYEVDVENLGPDLAENATLQFEPGFNFSLNSVTANGQSVDSQCSVGNTIECSLGDMAAEEQLHFIFDLNSLQTLTASSEFSINSVDTIDPNSANNNLSISVMVQGPPGMNITATTKKFSGNAGGSGAYVKWTQLAGKGVNFDKYHVRFVKKAVSSFEGIRHAKSYVGWNYYNLVGLQPGETWSFQVVPVKDTNPSWPSYKIGKWSEVGAPSNIVQCTISDSESAIECQSL